MTLAALALSLVCGINTARDVTFEPIVSLSSDNHIWRLVDKPRGITCYVAMPQRGSDAPPTIYCLSQENTAPSFMVHRLLHPVD